MTAYFELLSKDYLVSEGDHNIFLSIENRSEKNLNSAFLK